MISACFEAAALSFSLTKMLISYYQLFFRKLAPFRAILENAFKKWDALTHILLFQFSFHLCNLSSEYDVIRRFRAVLERVSEVFEVDNRDWSDCVWSLEIARFVVH